MDEELSLTKTRSRMENSIVHPLFNVCIWQSHIFFLVRNIETTWNILVPKQISEFLLQLLTSFSSQQSGYNLVHSIFLKRIIIGHQSAILDDINIIMGYLKIEHYSLQIGTSNTLQNVTTLFINQCTLLYNLSILVNSTCLDLILTMAWYCNV